MRVLLALGFSFHDFARRAGQEVIVFNVYNDHRGVNVKLPQERDIEGVRRLAESYATLGHNAFLRAFRVTSESVTGERFETAFSVLNGKVVEHPDVTFPKAHF